MPIRIHRAVEGKIKQITIKRHNSGKWFACICVEKDVFVTQREPKRAVGIDVGIKHFLSDSKEDRLKIQDFTKNP
jgi:putative transposase